MNFPYYCNTIYLIIIIMLMIFKGYTFNDSVPKNYRVARYVYESACTFIVFMQEFKWWQGARVTKYWVVQMGVSRNPAQSQWLLCVKPLFVKQPPSSW